MNKKGVVVGTVLFFLGLSFFTFALAKEEETLKVVDDPPTLEALKKYDQKAAEIRKICPPPRGNDLGARITKMGECFCKHMSEVRAANQIKIDALADLLKRHPELESQTIKIKGQDESWYLSQDELKKNTPEEFKMAYHCK